MGGAIGGGLVSQEGLFNSAFLKAKKFMKGKAISMGANAIVGMAFALTSHSGGTNTVLVVTGTAVKANF